VRSGQNLAALDEQHLSWLRCHRLGYIFQTFNLLPMLSARDNVAPRKGWIEIAPGIGDRKDPTVFPDVRFE
jgi:ABC-type lipoprotein export system ATPase subunit